MRNSKYLNKQFGNWTCTHVGTSYVQPVKKKHSNERSSRPGHQTYFYVMERRTSDNLADKMILLSAREASKVYHGVECVEELLNKKESRHSKKFTGKVRYCFD